MSSCEHSSSALIPTASFGYACDLQSCWAPPSSEADLVPSQLRDLSESAALTCWGCHFCQLTWQGTQQPKCEFACGPALSLAFRQSDVLRFHSALGTKARLANWKPLLCSLCLHWLWYMDYIMSQTCYCIRGGKHDSIVSGVAWELYSKKQWLEGKVHFIVLCVGE